MQGHWSCKIVTQSKTDQGFFSVLHMIGFLRILPVGIVLAFLAMAVHASGPTPAQIQAFKSMSPAEQSALAQQFGVTIPKTGSSETIPQPVQQTTIQPREIDSADTDQATSAPADLRNGVHGESGVLKSFGYELFAGSPSTFAPVTDVPVSSDYLLGSGDSLKVNMYGKESQLIELVIDSEGSAFIPSLGPIELAGLTFSEAKKAIAKTVNQKMIGVTAVVSMGQLKSIRVFVLGEAYKPGSYVVSSLTTVTNALLLSGGVAQKGSLRNIQIKRSGKLIATFDLYDLLLKGDTSKDLLLQSGDVVFIPPVGKTVGVRGEVLRPARYELQDNETVGSLLSMAGGLLVTAHPGLAKLERMTEGDAKVLIDLDLGTDDKASKLHDGDLVSIQPKLGLLDNYISVNGPVFRPGQQTFREGMTIAQALGNAGVTTEFDPSYAVLVRQEELGRISVLAFNLNNAGMAYPLSARDELHLFAVSQDRSAVLAPVISRLNAQASTSEAAKEVTVTGSVRFPGTYPLAESMNVNDLILAAGGLTEKAYLLSADLTRRLIGDDQKVEVIRQEVLINDAAAMSAQLFSRDVIQIKSIPNWAEKATIELTGEFNFPGTYTIYKNDTLYDLIQRAGGLTQYAYTPAALFTRKELREQQARRVTEMRKKLTADIAKAELIGGDSLGKEKDQEVAAEVGEAQKLLGLLDQSPILGRLVVDLDRVLVNTSDYKIPLEDGDRLHVPSLQNSISVIGEVQQPLSLIFQPELDYWEYVKKSGGTTLNADEDRIYIVRASGDVVMPETSSWFSRAQTEMAPGDTIVVPLHPEKVDQVVLWKDLSQIMYQIGLGAAAVGSL